jgi:hypothetical protein
MTNSVYFTIGLVAFLGLCFMWDIALKELFLNMFRERVFGLRFELFEMGVSGELPFDDDTYRSVEILLCSVLRYAYRFTWLRFYLWEKEQNQAKQEKNYEDLGQQLSLKISRTEPAVQAKLNSVVARLHDALIMYMAFTSLYFLAGFAVYYVRGRFGARSAPKDKKVTSVLEQEAYCTYLRSDRLAEA